MQIDEMRPLLHDDHESETERVAVQDRARDQVRHRAESQAAREQESDAGAPDEQRRQDEAQGRVATGETQRRGRQHRGRGRGRGHDRVTAAAEDAVADKPREQRDYARLRRQARQT